jgi:transposase-like protein
MARRRRTPEQIIRKLAKGHKLLAAGKTVEEVCREFQIAESTWARWLNQYGGMKADDAKRLKQLETENAELKRLLADAVNRPARVPHFSISFRPPTPPRP